MSTVGSISTPLKHIVDLMGKIRYNQHSSCTQNSITVPIAHLKSGIYFIFIAGKQTLKIIKSNE
ncbi:MAG TPA: hypothetical protein PK006_13470 [Saprospiraceae bacterium]|nr:hypothetical protein [Saprospiraceae bacterium]